MLKKATKKYTLTIKYIHFLEKYAKTNPKKG